MNLSPRAPQGPSDEELNRIPPDPLLPRFGGNNLAAAIYNAGMIAVATGGSIPDRSRAVIASRERR